MKVREYWAALLTVIVLACALALWWRPSGKETGGLAGAPPPPNPEAVEIFQRAFWRRPDAEDRILQAERHEWTDAEGVSQWQWFIVVEPSAGLVSYLRNENVLGLVPAGALPALSKAPLWFTPPPKGVDVRQAPRSDFYVIFTEEDRRLYATDAGSDFHSGIPDQEPILQDEPPRRTGRLPLE